MKHHTKTKGDIAVAATIKDLTAKGYVVFVPISEHNRYDLVVDVDGRVLRLQVKYCTDHSLKKKTSWADKNGNHSKNYEIGDFDYYAAYFPDLDIVLYPSIKFKGATIRTTPANSPTAFYWYEDFFDFTDFATKKTYKDFGINIVEQRITKVYSREKKKLNISLDEFSKLLQSNTQVDVAKLLGVCEETVSKWRKELNLSTPHPSARKVIRPSKEELSKLLWEKPTMCLAEDFGVSDKAVEKWAKAYGISKPPRGYWAKLKAAGNKESNYNE